MKTICVHKFGDPAMMKLEDAPDPMPGAGQVLVKIDGNSLLIGEALCDRWGSSIRRRRLLCQTCG